MVVLIFFRRLAALLFKRHIRFKDTILSSIAVSFQFKLQADLGCSTNLLSRLQATTLQSTVAPRYLSRIMDRVKFGAELQPVRLALS